LDAATANLQPFTRTTPTTVDTLRDAVDTIRTTGFGRADRSFEAEVQGLSAPLYDHTGQFAGAVSVASVAARFTPELEQIIQHHLVIASRQITHNWGGIVPAKIEALWAKSVTSSHALEFAS
jgi:DNA-binding IclR family transcriptional regulator